MMTNIDDFDMPYRPRSVRNQIVMVSLFIIFVLFVLDYALRGMAMAQVTPARIGPDMGLYDYKGRAVLVVDHTGHVTLNSGAMSQREADMWREVFRSGGECLIKQDQILIYDIKDKFIS